MLCYPMNVMSQSTSPSLHIVQDELSLDEENRDVSIHLINVSSLVRMSELRFRPWRRFVQESRHLPFGTGSTRPMRKRSGTIVTPRKFHGVPNALQVCRNPECGAQSCDIIRLAVLNPSAISTLQELNCVVLHVGSFRMEVVLNAPCLPGTL